MNKELTLDIHKLAGMTADQELVFISHVVPLIKSVVNSARFKYKITNYKWLKTTKAGPWWNRRYHKQYYPMFKGTMETNFQVYHDFMGGADKFNPVKDGDIDLYLTLYYSRKNVIGYTKPSTFKTWVNKRYFNHWLKSPEGRCKIVGNIIHEYCHNLGYGHAFRSNSTRKHTVPYAIGEIARKMALELI